jgi:predicted ATPase
MNRPHVQRLRIQNYGCIEDVTLALTPLHALIGPNDSGKSTVLTALRTLTTLAAGLIGNADDSGKLAAAMITNAKLVFEADVQGEVWRVTNAGLPYIKEEIVQRGIVQRESSGRHISHVSQVLREDAVKRALAGSTLFRLEPDSLRMPTHLIAEGQPLRFSNALGLGLPAIYDAIITRDLPAYIAIGKRLGALFPTVKGLSPRNITQDTKALGVQLLDGTFVGADFMSEGMLYFLAYAALPYLEPTAMILIEEPENGLHPARIREVMGVLRELSMTTQVVLATHSPLVVNELRPEEVTVLTRDASRGTTATRIKDTPNFDERSKVYALGELWVSYADGELEAPLFKEPEPIEPPGDPVETNDPAES